MTPGTVLTEALDLRPLPDEGGWYRETYQDENHSTILFLVADGEFSALHTLSADEEYSYLAGAPLQLLLLGDNGPREIVLDAAHPQFVVKAGLHQGSSSAGDWTLVTTKVTPPFNDAMFALSNRSELRTRWPAASARIDALTRTEPHP